MRNTILIAGLLALLASCGDTERAADAARDANEDVAAQAKDVREAEAKLEEEEGELLEAQATADTKAAKLERTVSEDTAARRKP